MPSGQGPQNLSHNQALYSKALFVRVRVKTPVPSLKGLGSFHRFPGTSVPGYRVPPLRGWGIGRFHFPSSR